MKAELILWMQDWAIVKFQEYYAKFTTEEMQDFAVWEWVQDEIYANPFATADVGPEWEYWEEEPDLLINQILLRNV